jgi:gamma-glutamylcyclotransferase (GGCT)/AIG2-like uncharacterized protein YtfP
MVHPLFVYGTLLPGLCRYDAMQGAVWCGAAHIHAQLYDLGPYPAVLAGEGLVWGELAEVDDALLHRLDAMEEYHVDDPAQSEYRRERCIAWLGDGLSCEAWVYVYNRAVTPAQRIVHGDYLRHLQDTGYTPTL